VNLESLITAFKEQGFDYLSNPACERYLNDGYLLDICEEEEWPFLESTVEGTSPLEISNLRAVEFVIDSTQELELRPLDRRHLVADVNTDLTTTGTPYYYYLTTGNTVNVFPVAADTLKVRYWKVPPTLTGNATPLLPERFHSVIVDAAVARAYTDSDDYELSEARKAQFEQRLAAMRESLGVQHRDGSDAYIEITDPASL